MAKTPRPRSWSGAAARQEGAPAPAAAAAAPADTDAAALNPSADAAWRVLLLAPNVVGHVRLLLIAAAVSSGSCGAHPLCIALFLVALLLDALDGCLARALNQESSFGAAYDIAIDLTARGILWTWTARSPLAVLPVLLECLTFAATHARSVASGEARHWKDLPAAPRWVQAVMAHGLRNPLGAVAVLGLYGCPLWLHARRVVTGPSAITAPAWGLLFVPGRLLAAAVELHVLASCVLGLLRRDAVELRRRWGGGAGSSPASPAVER